MYVFLFHALRLGGFAFKRNFKIVMPYKPLKNPGGTPEDSFRTEVEIGICGALKVYSWDEAENEARGMER